MAIKILLGWTVSTLGLWLASKLLRGVRLASFTDAIWAGALLGVLQWALHKPIFYLLGVGTLGLGFLLWFITTWVASALVILLASKLSGRFSVNGFGMALVTAFIIAATNSVVRWLV